VALRSAVLCSQALPQTSTALDHLVHHTLTPRGLVEALEALVREGGRLRRAQATQIEEAILRHTTATGQWQAEPDGSPPPVHA